MLGISLYSYLYRKLAKMVCLSYYVFSLTKLSKRSEQVPGREEGVRGQRARGRGGPNNVYTYE
jgi:hypothetical protein